MGSVFSGYGIDKKFRKTILRREMQGKRASP